MVDAPKTYPIRKAGGPHLAVANALAPLLPAQFPHTNGPADISAGPFIVFMYTWFMKRVSRLIMNFSITCGDHRVVSLLATWGGTMDIITLTENPVLHIWLVSGAWGAGLGALSVLLIYRSSRLRRWWLLLVKGLVVTAVVTLVVQSGANVDTSMVVTDNLVAVVRYRGQGLAFRTDHITRIEVVGQRVEITTDAGNTYDLSGPAEKVARTIAAKTNLRLAEGARTLLWTPPVSAGNDVNAVPVTSGTVTIHLDGRHPVTDWAVAIFVGLCMMGLITFIVRVEVERTHRPIWLALGLGVTAVVIWWMGTVDRPLSVVITDQTIKVTHLRRPDEVLETQHVTLIEEQWNGTKRESQSLVVSTDQGQSIVLQGHHKDVADAIGPRAGLHEVDNGELIRWVR